MAPTSVWCFRQRNSWGLWTPLALRMGTTGPKHKLLLGSVSLFLRPWHLCPGGPDSRAWKIQAWQEAEAGALCSRPDRKWEGSHYFRLVHKGSHGNRFGGSRWSSGLSSSKVCGIGNTFISLSLSLLLCHLGTEQSPKEDLALTWHNAGQKLILSKSELK